MAGDKKVGTLQLGVQAQAKGFEGAIGGIAKMGLALSGIQTIAKTAARSITMFTDAANEQEKVNARLMAALDNVGKGTKANFKTLERYAAEIQGVTTYGDEATLGAMQLALSMGVQFENLKEATRGAVGLAAAYDLGLKPAMQMVALAEKGNYSMLKRKITAMDGVTDKVELATLANEAMANGFKLAEAAAKTAGGQMDQFQNAAGDVKQIVGGLLNEALLPLIKRMKELALTLSGQPELVRNVTKAIGGLILAFAGVKITTAMVGLAAFFKTTLPAALLIAKAALLGIGGVIGAIVVGLGAIIFYYNLTNKAEDELSARKYHNAKKDGEIIAKGEESRRKLYGKTVEEIAKMDNGLALLQADGRARILAGHTLETEALKIRNNTALLGIYERMAAVHKLIKLNKELNEEQAKGFLPDSFVDAIRESQIENIAGDIRGLGEEYTVTLELALGATNEFAERSMEAWNRIGESFTGSYGNMTATLQEFATRTFSIINSLSNQLATTLTDAMFGVETNWGKVFQNMLRSFVQMLTQMLIKFIATWLVLQALNALSGGVLFATGATIGQLFNAWTMSSSFFAPSGIAFGGAPDRGGANVVVNVNNPLLTDEMSYSRIASNIKKALLKQTFYTTGEVYV